MYTELQTHSVNFAQVPLARKEAKQKPVQA